jgi:hypothetical protein
MNAHSIVKLRKGFYSGLEGKPDVLVTYVDKMNDKVVVRYSNGDRHEVPMAAVLESSILRIGGYNYLPRLQRFEAYEELLKSPKFYERLLQYYPESELVTQRAPVVEEEVHAVVAEQDTDEVVVLLRDIKNSLAELVSLLK